MISVDGVGQEEMGDGIFVGLDGLAASGIEYKASSLSRTLLLSSRVHCS